VVTIYIKAVPQHIYGGTGEGRYSSYSFTTSALEGAIGQRHAPAALYPGRKDSGTHCTGSWVGLRPGLNTEVKRKILLPLPGIDPRSTGRPVRSQVTILTELTRLPTICIACLYLWVSYNSKNNKTVCLWTEITNWSLCLLAVGTELVNNI
jgi:hypothetical protein